MIQKPQNASAKLARPSKRIVAGLLVAVLAVPLALPSAAASHFLETPECTVSRQGPVTALSPDTRCVVWFGCGWDQGSCSGFPFTGTITGLGVVQLKTSRGECIGVNTCTVTDGWVTVAEGFKRGDQCVIGPATASASTVTVHCSVTLT